MAAESKTSFSTSRRWAIGLDVVVRTIVVVAVVVMANYLGVSFSRQFFLSSQTRIHLSPRTVSVLQSLTNHVDVTVYYDKDDGLYTTIMALLKEYHRIDPRIQVKAVDYIRDPGEAAQIANKYHLVASDKNTIIFDGGGKIKVAPGERLAEYGPVGMKDKKIEFRPVAFDGEKMFTSMLMAVTTSRPFMAYFLQGDGEPSLADSSSAGYLKFGAILEEDYIEINPLSLLGSRDVPRDCDLLIIAGPTQPFSSDELSKIDNYLSGGGRLLALFAPDYGTQNHVSSGLEDLLAEHWGVNVGIGYVTDPDNSATHDGSLVSVPMTSQHPAVNSLAGSSLLMALPRPITRINNPDAPNDSLTVSALATSSEDSTLSTKPGFPPQPFALIAAVEQNPVKGIANANGNTRIIVVGDSLFLDNDIILDRPVNGDFASSAANWLLDRPTLLNGIGPQPVSYFHLVMTQKQIRNVRWLLLGALPGAVMAVGGLVWLRRRK